MLGDNPEKSKNPLKKAIKRRNAKAVQFAPPPYVEPSDVDYSSEEEGGDQPLYGDQLDPQVAQQETQSQQATSAAVEPLKIKTSKSDNSLGRPNGSSDDLTTSPEKTKPLDDLASDNQGRTPPKSLLTMLTHIEEDSSPRSRNGVLRNTDSFFRDDSAETRKITLTPNLLRDDSGKESQDKEVSRRLKFAFIPC